MERSDSQPAGDNNTGFDTITPASVSLEATPLTKEADQRNGWRQYGAYGLALTVLLLLLVSVIFILPSLVPPPQPQTVDNQQPLAIKPSTPLESPWSDAQLARQRLAAQHILALLLTRQTELEAKQVLQWGAKQFNAAMAQAAAGDEHYRRREFDQAQTKYRQTLVQFDALLKYSREVFEQALSDGQQALTDELADKAITAYQLALTIDNNNHQAQTGLRRSEVLEQVLDLLDQGRALEQQLSFEQARSRYLDANELDDASSKVRQSLTRVNRAILERDFSKAMSAGYLALDQQRFEQSRQAFAKAAKLKPSSSGPAQAMVQVNNQHTQSQINSLLTQGRSQEQQELWQRAAGTYQQALDLDNSVVKARIGKIRATARNALDQQLTKAIASPHRLINPQVYQQVQALYRDAQAIKQPGPLLTRQQRQLEQLLTDAVKDISVLLESDNQTQITLYKVGKLGSFTSRQLLLKPGIYTVVGTRDGYRDVRHEFTVKPREATQTIDVRCLDKITNG